MWRPVRVLSKNCVRLRHVDSPKCSFATTAQNGNKGKGVIILTSAAVLGVGGTLAYAKYDPKFEKVLEENIPYIDVILKNLPNLGSDSDQPPKPPLPTKETVREKAIESGLLKKKQDRLKQEVKPQVESESKVGTTTTSKTVEPTHAASSAVATSSKQPSPSAVDDTSTKVKKDPETPVIDLQLEKSIKQLTERAVGLSREAVKAQDAAASAIQRHASALYLALDSSETADENEIWNQAHAASTDRITFVNLAKKARYEAKAVVDDLKREVSKVAQNDQAKKRPVVISAEETVARVIQELDNAEAHVAAAEADAKVASDYKDMIDKGKEQFIKELETLLPKDHLGDSKAVKDLSEEEISLLIAHAHKKIEQLQKQFAKQKVTEMLRVQEAMKLQKLEDDKVVDSKIAAEVERQRRELDSSFQRRLSMLQEEFEAEMRLQLRRQAAAHSDHLKEALEVQREELNHRFKQDTESKLLHQKGVFISKLSESMARLASIEGYLKARAEFDKKMRKTQSLWLACQAMKNTIKKSNSDYPNPISRELAAIKDASGDDNQFVTVMLAGLPPEAVERGIYSDEVLKQRFEKVHTICRRVALIGNGGSLFKYILSYLQSFLIYEVKTVPKAELEGKVAVDLSKWDTFDVLSRVNFCLQRNDLEQALRYANQLRGEPKNVAKDWIAELRLLLETKQVADALTAYAAAIGVQAYH